MIQPSTLGHRPVVLAAPLHSLAVALLWAFAVAATGGVCQAAEPVSLRYADPASESWRISRFPELQGRGLRCLCEDRAGRMWFGLRDQALCYDGRSWTSYGRASGWTGTAVETLTARSDGSVVAGSREGLFQWTPQSERWTPLLPSDQLSPFAVTSVHETSDGSLWACSPWGLLRLHQDRWTLYTSGDLKTLLGKIAKFETIIQLPDRLLPHETLYRGTGIGNIGRVVTHVGQDSPAAVAGLQPGDRILAVDGEPSNLFRSLARDADQQIELLVRRGDTHQMETLPLTTTAFDGSYRCPDVHSLMEDRQGRIWVGLTCGRLLMTPDQGNSWQTWTRQQGLVVGTRPVAIELTDGQIWVVSEDRNAGLCRLESGQWHSEKLSMLFGSRYISAAAQTIDGTVWISGLNRLHLWRHGQWTMHDTRDLNIPGDSHRMCVTADNALWIIGYDQPAVRIAMSPQEYLSLDGFEYQCSDQSGDRWFIEAETKRVVRDDGQQTVAYGVDDGLMDHPTRVVAVPGKGAVALGSHHAVASVATLQGSSWSRQEFPELARYFANEAVAVTRDGRVWAAARSNRVDNQVGGVVVGYGDQWQHIRPPLAPRHCNTAMTLPDDRVLFAGGFGVVIHDGSQWTAQRDPLLQDVSIASGAIDGSGTVWLSTRSNGMLSYRNDRWHSWTTDDGLASNDVTDVAASSGDDVWVHTGQGICRFNGNGFQRVELPPQLGRKSLRAGSGSSVWIDGSYRYTPDTDAPTAVAEETALEMDVHSRTLISWQGSDAWNRTPAEKLLWSYRLNQQPWSSFRQQNQLVLKNLPAGQHRVEMRSRDADLNVSTSSAPVMITVLPALWMRPWFLSLAAGLLGVLLWQANGLIRRGIALRHSHAQLVQARKQIAERFAEKSAQFRAICDCSPIGIFVADIDGKVTYFNHHLEKVIQCSTQTAAGDGWVAAVHPDDRDRVVATWNENVRLGRRHHCRGRFLHDDGTITWFETVADRIESGGELLGYVGAVEDVTQRIQSRQELEHSNGKLRAAVEQLQLAQDKAIERARLGALGQMAAGVAHDVNNSLAPLLTYSELLAGDKSLRGKSRQWVDLIRMGVTDTAAIVKRLDHFYRESHNPQLLQSTCLSDIVSQAVELTRHHWQTVARADGKRIEMHVDNAAHPAIACDPAQIRAVLTNLIFNAVDAISEQGKITIRVAQHHELAVLEVIDNGLGMTDDQLSRCQDAFYTTKPKGSGLGLCECNGVIRQHGGQLEIDSQPSRGTRVKIVLPSSSKHSDPNDSDSDSSESDSDRDAEDDPPHSLSTTRSGSNPIFQSPDEAVPTAPRVLHIDDDAMVLRSTAALLRSLGIDAESATDGPSGLKRLQERPFQLVICDRGLPGMDGIAVLREIRAGWPEVPVVMVSGWSLPQLPDGIQPDDFLEKPVAYEDLVGVLQRHLTALPSL